MSTPNNGGSKEGGRGLSLDTWAVALALALALLVRIGLLSRVPW